MFLPPAAGHLTAAAAGVQLLLLLPSEVPYLKRWVFVDFLISGHVPVLHSDPGVNLWYCIMYMADLNPGPQSQ